MDTGKGLGHQSRPDVKTHTHKDKVYIPLKPPFPIPSDNTALRVRVSTPLQTTVSLRLLPPGSLPGTFYENEAIFRWAKTPFFAPLSFGCC